MEHQGRLPSPAPFAAPRGPSRKRESGSRRMARKAILLAVAGAAPPPLPAIEDSGRSVARREAEKRWVLYGLRAGLTRRHLMAAIGRSETTTKRRVREVRLEVATALGRQSALAVELASRCDAALRGQEPAPLTEHRMRELLAFAERDGILQDADHA